MDSWSYDASADLVEDKPIRRFIGYWRLKIMLCDRFQESSMTLILQEKH